MCGARMNCSTAIVQSVQTAKKRTRFATASAMSGAARAEVLPDERRRRRAEREAGQDRDLQRAQRQRVRRELVRAQAGDDPRVHEERQHELRFLEPDRQADVRQPPERIARDAEHAARRSCRTGAAPLAASASASTPPVMPAVAYPMPEARTPRSATWPLISRNVTPALIRLTMIRITIGIHVLPMPRSEPLTAYSAISIGKPSEPARRYSTPSGCDFGLRAHRAHDDGANVKTIAVQSSPQTSAAMIAVCSPSCTRERSPAPMSRATTAVEPTSIASAPASGIQNSSEPMPTAASPSAPT